MNPIRLRVIKYGSDDRSESEQRPETCTTGRQHIYRTHPCEYCKCCSCQRVCTKCGINCCPADSYFIPVIGCPDFIDMREIDPVRYLYRYECGGEYKLHLPRMR
jgi:hypothetical protein